MSLNLFEYNLTDWLLRLTASNAVRRVADLSIAVASNVGLVRKENQDRTAVFRFFDRRGQENILVVLCDGMGGMEDGASCAAISLASFCCALVDSPSWAFPEQRLHQAVLYANKKVFDIYKGSGGATLSALLMLPNERETYLVNVGDSRIYEHRANSINQLTTDDTLAGQLAREPEAYDGRNELLQFIGAGEAVEPHVRMRNDSSEALTYLITSDGVHFLSQKIIQDLVINAKEPAVAARRLIDLAMWCGGHDNASIAVINSPLNTKKNSLVLQHNVLEVWDPFGEARFYGIASSIHKNFSSSLNVKTNEANVDNDSYSRNSSMTSMIDDAEKLKKDSEEKNDVDKAEVRRKRTIRKKKILEESTPQLTEAGLPQLKINFQKKDGAE